MTTQALGWLVLVGGILISQLIGQTTLYNIRKRRRDIDRRSHERREKNRLAQYKRYLKTPNAWINRFYHSITKDEYDGV